MKYIFITGGVASSLGKGLVAASIGTLLEQRGLNVFIQKFDPYLNVDPGTMNPYQHGEVYVLNDGTETDLDLGHYERFTHCKLSKTNNLTSGKVFESVLTRERRGEYLGSTVQFIPHVTDEIKNRLKIASETSNTDVIITEIGGTVGDIEAHLFLEAIRQFSLEIDKTDICFIHVTLLPYIKAAGETKTKPTQQSVAKLREIGIQPDIIICRSEVKIGKEHRDKIAMFCNIHKNSVIPFYDTKYSIYECPLNLHKDKIDNLIVEKLNIKSSEPNLAEWEKFIENLKNPQEKRKIAVVGKYIELQDTYKSIYEALTHASGKNRCKVEVLKIDSEAINPENVEKILKDAQGILIPGGFGNRGIEGKILSAKYAREKQIPYFGICLGLQIAIIEFSRNICGLQEANSTEFNEKTNDPVICLQENQKDIEEKGGTMRLGAYKAILEPKTLASQLYQEKNISERHRHRYECNPDYLSKFNKNGLVVSATCEKNGLVELIEIPSHPFYIACQFHPEFQSKPSSPHPLFTGFIKAVLDSH